MLEQITEEAAVSSVHIQKSSVCLFLYLGDVVDQVLVAVLRVNLPQLRQPLQVALDLVLLALQRQAVVHHRFDLLHLLWSFGVSDGSPLHGALVFCFLSSRETRLSLTTFLYKELDDRSLSDRRIIITTILLLLLTTESFPGCIHAHVSVFNLCIFCLCCVKTN